MEACFEKQFWVLLCIVALLAFGLVVGAAVVGDAVVVFVVGKSMRESHSSFVLQMVVASISASVALLPVKAKQRKFRKCV